LLKADARYIVVPSDNTNYPSIQIDKTVNLDNGDYFSKRDKKILSWGVQKVREVFDGSVVEEVSRRSGRGK
tara:strand:- start:145 stop:357 length:213 start_codon:yes stop_codon:yes gene_type:complete